MKKLIWLIILVTPLALSMNSYAQAISCLDKSSTDQGCMQVINTQPILHAMGILNTKSFPIYNLKKGLKVSKITYGDIDQESGVVFDPQDGGAVQHTSTDSDGEGIAFNYFWGRSVNTGVNISAAYAKNVGGIRTNNIEGADQSSIYSGDHSDKGYFVSASWVYEPFGNPKGFRLPLFVGASYLKAKGRWGPINFTYGGSRAGHKGIVESSYEWGGLGWNAGISAQYLTGPFRWAVFIAVVEPFRDSELTYAQTDLDTGETVINHNRDSQSGGQGGALEVSYIPWGLSFAWAPTFLNDVDSKEGETVDTFTLSFSWRFGVKKPAAREKKKERPEPPTP